jgi:hypothetical protein
MSSLTSGPPTRLPGFDPETVPLDPDFADPARRGLPVPPGALQPAALRRRFAEPPSWSPEMRSDARLFDPGVEPRPASVLVPLVVRDSGVHVLLTQRTAHLTDHAGQISLPSPVVDVLGWLPEYRTVTGYRVTPVVALIERPFALRLDTFEVSEAFEVPLAFLMDPANHERRLYRYADIARTFYAMPYQAVRRYFIWGATAAMLRNFYHFLRA